MILFNLIPVFAYLLIQGIEIYHGVRDLLNMAAFRSADPGAEAGMETVFGATARLLNRGLKNGGTSPRA
jgi:hypothetical protein